jgi:hypothetical protein
LAGAVFVAGGVFCGAAPVFALAAGSFGVGDGFAALVFEFTGTGTRITPPSVGMNGLPVAGSIVTT